MKAHELYVGVDVGKYALELSRSLGDVGQIANTEAGLGRLIKAIRLMLS